MSQPQKMSLSMFVSVTSVFLARMMAMTITNATGIYETIAKAVLIDSLEPQSLYPKIVGFGCDGATVNSGKKNGVIVIMHQEMNDRIIMSHCMAHRLELAFKNSIQDDQ